MANLAGVPAKVIRRAREILKELEAGEHAAPGAKPREDEAQVSLSALGEQEVLNTLRSTPLETLTPLQALNLLNELKEKL